jgi:hypothetical protein
MTSSEKKLARALRDAEVTGLSNADVRLVQLRIRTLSDIVARVHDQRISELTAENARLRERLAEVEAKTHGVNELDEFIKQHGVK